MCDICPYSLLTPQHIQPQQQPRPVTVAIASKRKVRSCQTVVQCYPFLQVLRVPTCSSITYLMRSRTLTWLRCSHRLAQWSVQRSLLTKPPISASALALSPMTMHCQHRVPYSQWMVFRLVQSDSRCSWSDHGNQHGLTNTHWWVSWQLRHKQALNSTTWPTLYVLM